MSQADDTAAETPHIDQSIPIEWRAVEQDGSVLVVHDLPEGGVDCYEVSGTTTNVRVAAHADALLYEGAVVAANFNSETKWLELQHCWAGRKGRFEPSEWFDAPVVLLEKCQSTDLSEAFDNIEL